ncbi:MAG: hypothetical protein K2Y25_09315 [Pseudomonadaceae bacterium]|nr:hypothetical protein [Pseudomonadaceae bacterium]
MNRGDLRERLRKSYLDDVAAPFLWSDDLLDALIEESQQEAVIRSRMLHEVVSVVLVPGQGEYALPTTGLDVTRVKPAGLRPLARTSLQELDDSGNWVARQGTATHYSYTALAFGGDGKLTIYPLPAAAGTAQVSLQRMPLAIASDGAELEIPAHLHVHLLDWAAFRAFSLRDSDSEDSSRAAKHESVFTDRFGARLSANTLRKRAEKRPHRTRINQDWR